jgi:hypothetical protein
MGAADNTMLWFFSDNGDDPNGRNHPLRGRKSPQSTGAARAQLPF